MCYQVVHISFTRLCVSLEDSDAHAHKNAHKSTVKQETPATHHAAILGRLCLGKNSSWLAWTPRQMVDLALFHRNKGGCKVQIIEVDDEVDKKHKKRKINNDVEEEDALEAK